MEIKINAIIVDDEASARDVLQNLLNRFCPEVEILNTCSNLIEAVETIKISKPDVVFLDIEMPNYAGYEIVSFFKEIDFDIVFVTAYDKYAIKAFEVSAVDYILKPVEIDRLKETVLRLIEQKTIRRTREEYEILSENLKNEEVSKIIIRDNKGQKIINTKDIIAIEANESYSYIYTKSNKQLVSKNLKYFEKVLKDNNSFFRSHKSWIVNVLEIISFSKSKLEIQLCENVLAKLSKYKKADFENIMLKIVKNKAL